MSDWKRIETAPLDGTRVLIYRENWEEHTLVGWAHADGDWCVAGGYPLAGPTHWMELPEPPEVK